MCGDADQRSVELWVDHVAFRHTEVRKGSLFVAARGAHVDGHTLTDEAVARGAAGILAEHEVANVRVPILVRPDAREAGARVAMATVQDLVDRMDVVGVTGTDGKTTTCWILRDLLRSRGPVALCGTIEIDDGLTRQQSELTTPGTSMLVDLIVRAAANGCRSLVVELSSHALHQGRAAGLPLSAAVVTNLRRDHLDYHGGLTEYAAAKAKIAGLLRSGRPLLIGGDTEGHRLLSEHVPRNSRCITVGFGEVCEVRGRRANGLLHVDGRPEWGGIPFPLPGRHNAENLLIAMTAAAAVGADPWRFAEAAIGPVPGRMERVGNGEGPDVRVDYAHTPAAIAAAVACGRELLADRSGGAGRLVAVCGAGGDRDRGKRPLMGRQLGCCDRVVLTTDNARGESAAEIAAEIRGGGGDRAEWDVVLDRAEAIAAAVWCADRDDVVLILGKGHERTQTIGDAVRPFEDRAVAAQALTTWRQDAR